MGIKTVPHPPYSPNIARCDFWLFPKIRGCRYETSEEMKDAVTKVIDTFIQQDFHGAFQKLLERYKCIAAGGDHFEGEESFMCVLSIKVPLGNSLETYLMILVCKWSGFVRIFLAKTCYMSSVPTTISCYDQIFINYDLDCLEILEPDKD